MDICCAYTTFTHLFIYLVIHSFIHLPIQPSIHSFIHSFVNSHSYIHSFKGIHSFIHSFIQTLPRYSHGAEECGAELGGGVRSLVSDGVVEGVAGDEAADGAGVPRDGQGLTERLAVHLQQGHTAVRRGWKGGGGGGGRG